MIRTLKVEIGTREEERVLRKEGECGGGEGRGGVGDYIKSSITVAR